MPAESRLLQLELLRCPRCLGRIASAGTFCCSSCSTTFPTLAGVPWLFPDPAAALGEWRARTHGFLAALESQATHYRNALTDDVTRAATRNRLKLLAAACTDHARRLRALLAPLLDDAPAAAPELYSALGATLPAGQGLTGYYANLHRDWCWGEAENEAAFRLVDDALGQAPPGRTLLLGVGAGRLAYDLHCRRNPSTLVAADINPLFLLAASRLYAGETLELYEFPIAPRDVASHAILRRLQAPAPAGPGLHLVYADVTRAPFAEGAFDTVITPWLIDVLDDDLPVFARRVNRWLRPGGRWVNSGSLSFSSNDPARRYALEEVRELVAESGFEAPTPTEAAVPYLCSPASRHGRTESVVTFAATKIAEVERPAPARRGPEWLARADVPVPLLPPLQRRQLEVRVIAFVAGLVDGRRSVQDIAAVLVERRMMTAEEAVPAVHGFLRRLHDESTADRGPSPPL